MCWRMNVEILLFIIKPDTTTVAHHVHTQEPKKKPPK